MNKYLKSQKIDNLHRFFQNHFAVAIVRVIAGFCSSLVYNMIVERPGNMTNSKYSLEQAIGFYSNGFRTIHSTLYEEKNKPNSNKKNEEFAIIPFIAQIAWSIIFWGSLIVPFTGWDFSFNREYIFKENFKSGEKWNTYEDNRANIKIKEGKLFVQCKEDPNDNSYEWTMTKCTFPMYNCPSKYTLEIKCELIAGIESRPFGLIFADRGGVNFIRFSANGAKKGSVTIKSNNEYKETCKDVTINSKSKDYEIRIEVRADTYTYYLNDTEICSDKFGGFVPYYFGAFVSRSQSAEFDDIFITKD